jgi:hypothetical protein
MKNAIRIVSVVAAFAIAPALVGDVGAAQAAPASHCSQVNFAAQAACTKRNSKDFCDRLIGPRMNACMKTGCWTNARGKRCGLVRL